MEAIIGVLGVVVSIALYFAGVRHGRRQDQARREHELQMEQMRQEHERSLETDRRRHELISKVADEYTSMARRHLDSGPHALATLGLEQLGSDADIRAAIHEMAVRSGNGKDPWSGLAHYVEDVDLVAFFRYVRDNGIDFFKKSVEQVASEVRAQGHLRPPTHDPAQLPPHAAEA